MLPSGRWAVAAGPPPAASPGPAAGRVGAAPGGREGREEGKGGRERTEALLGRSGEGAVAFGRPHDSAGEIKRASDRQGWAEGSRGVSEAEMPVTVSEVC